ncbi:trichohyalin-like isoform X1 [Anopheles arabiensis]|uniref:trichohyalin-like isoform X1 n=1 Tax=Anopheles arabiensis TaxID=7173 RepID=UPI001AAD344F|nr:trichohyalin-like isoform X1 [Anopheles arabiensis]
MGKDSVREKDLPGMAAAATATSGSRRSGRPVSASPYSEHYRPPIDLCQRHLINHRLLVSKLTRRELEDKYLSLCDENYTIKKRFLEQEELIKRLKTKLSRLSNESNQRSKSRLDMASSEHYSRLHDLELQRRELHEKLEALRRATSNDGRMRENSVCKARQSAPASSQRRSKSARPAKETAGGRRECKSTSPSADGYDEREERLRHRLTRQAGGKGRTSTDDRTEDDEEEEEEEEEESHAVAAARRSSHRKSYGADDEEEEEEEEDEDSDDKDVRETLDEDRDVLSGGGSEELNESERDSPASGAAGGAKSISKGRRHAAKSKGRQAAGAHCPDCERHRAEQVTRETDLVKMKLNIKYLHKELQNEKEKSTLLARQLEEKLSYEIMKRNAAENLEILNLNRQVEDLAKELQRQVDEQKRSMEHELRKQGDLEAQIRKEKDKNASLFEECERLKKNIEKLKENMSEVEIERDFLKRQQENFTKIVDENKLLKYQLDELRKHNEELLRQIDTLREEELVTKESQRELLEKLKTLQQDNDTLSVMLEGLRTENVLLAEERTQLEQSLKSLEASPIKEVRPVSPAPVVTVSASVQTEQLVREHEPLPAKEPKVFLREPSAIERRVPPQELVSGPAIEPIAPLSRCSSVVARMSRDRHVYESAEAAQQIFRQVSVSQMIPKLSHIMNNRIEPAKVNNVELLIANRFPESLEKSFREDERFHKLQTATRRRNRDLDSISSGVSDRRRISFLDAGSSSETVSKGGDHMVKQNYARYFDIQRLPSMWHRIAENPMSISPTTTTPTVNSQDDNDGGTTSDLLTIEIRSVRWNQLGIERLLASSVLFYYVEFTFLDLYGHLLETPLPAKLITEDGEVRQNHNFNFRVAVELGTTLHAERRAVLKKMLRPDGNDAVRFVVVNENRASGQHACEDIGYASVKLRNELQQHPGDGSEELAIDVPIYDFFHEHDELGMLRIVLDNVKLLQVLMGNES